MLQQSPHELATAALEIVIRFRALSVDDWKARLRNNKSDLLCSLNAHPDFNGWICGQEGRKALGELASIALTRDDAVRLAIHPITVRKAVEWQFCDRFMKKRQPITPDNVDRMLKRAAHHALTKRVDGCIAIPCRVTYDERPENFVVGGIQFVRTSAFLAQIRANGLSSTNQQLLEVPAFAEYLDRNPWIALATFHNMDPLLGEERAQMAVQAALELLAALLDPSRGERLVPATASMWPEATVYFTRKSTGAWSANWTRRALQTTFGEGWHEYLNDELRPFLETGGQAVAGLLCPRKAFPLEQRFLDGLHWFGLACRERSPASRIVACVFALERLSMTREAEDLGMLARAFAQRSILLAQGFVGLRAVQWFPDFQKLYNVRSRLAHGDISPTDATTITTASFALTATRAALLGCLAVYANLSRGRGSDHDLQKYFERVTPLT